MHKISKQDFKTFLSYWVPFLSYYLFVLSGIGAYLSMLDSPQKERLEISLLIFQMLGFSVFWYWLIYQLTEIVKAFKNYEG